VTGVQTCALPILPPFLAPPTVGRSPSHSHDRSDNVRDRYSPESRAAAVRPLLPARADGGAAGGARGAGRPDDRPPRPGPPAAHGPDPAGTPGRVPYPPARLHLRLYRKSVVD